LPKIITPVTIPHATIDAGVLTLKYDARALTLDLQANDEIIACSLLKTDELIMTMQFIGHEPIGILPIKYTTLQAEQVYVAMYLYEVGMGKRLRIRCMWK
jgi:hypothetical protein